MHRKDHVITRRNQRGDRRKTAKRASRNTIVPAWTLHRADCGYVTKNGPSSSAIPAPTKPYPGTVACQVCKPTLQEKTTDGQ
jgi:hypothetical protein